MGPCNLGGAYTGSPGRTLAWHCLDPVGRRARNSENDLRVDHRKGRVVEDRTALGMWIKFKRDFLFISV